MLAGYRAPKETRVQRVGRRTKGQALIDEEIIKVWHAAGKLGAFGPYDCRRRRVPVY